MIGFQVSMPPRPHTLFLGITLAQFFSASNSLDSGYTAIPLVTIQISLASDPRV